MHFHRELSDQGSPCLGALGGLAEKYAQAMAHAQGADDQKLILGALANVPHRDALKLATEYLKHADVRTEAALAVIAIARKLPASDAADTSAAMKLVIASVGDSAIQDQAKALIRRSPPVKNP